MKQRPTLPTKPVNFGEMNHMDRINNQNEAEICVIVEGTYPYVPGGVSTWVHDLCKSLDHLSFHIVCIRAATTPRKLAFKLPKNVVAISDIELHFLPKGASKIGKADAKSLFLSLEGLLLNMQTHPKLKVLEKIIGELKRPKRAVGSQVLMNSEDAFKMLTHMYNSLFKNCCFLDYFWAWRALMGGTFAMLLAPIPKARLYHAVSTGYAGLFLARARIETNKPCLLTEHGIYTNERRIELATADFSRDQRSLNFSMEKNKTDRSIQDFWLDIFNSFSVFCYEACDEIITLYEGNFELQMADGADAKKLRAIPNGIDFKKLSSLEKIIKPKKTVAFVGRVTPVKDVKTFVRAMKILLEVMPDIDCQIIGSNEEDPDYVNEVESLIEELSLRDQVKIVGEKKLKNFAGEIDVLVLTSLSESQPMIILELGARGVPSVASNVGSCMELLYGRPNEEPKLGKGGICTPLANPKATADAVYQLLSDENLYEQASLAIKTRVERYYNDDMQREAYALTYGKFVSGQRSA